MSGSPTSGSSRPTRPTIPKFQLLAKTKAEEDTYDFLAARNYTTHAYGVTASVAHLVKGALGGGILGGHAAYKDGGVIPSIVLTLVLGAYVGICLHLLIKAAHLLYKRTKTPRMSYADVGECALLCFPNPKVAKFSKPFRYVVDFVICLDLFGSCACYQLIIAKQIKQLVENTIDTKGPGIAPGYPDMKLYIVMFMVPIILICLIRHLKYLAPFSLAANAIIVVCAFTAVYYAFTLNPTFENAVMAKSPYNVIKFLGVAAFSMSCAGVVLPIENNMKNPAKFPVTITIGMIIITVLVFTISFFGYMAFLEKSDSPITINFPLDVFPKILKVLIALMIYVTHALNFWAPFNLVFVYISRCHNEKNIVCVEYIYRTLFVIMVSIIAIVFPEISSLMGFLGSFCLSLMAFVWPNIIYILTIWHRPGFGRYKWELWRSLFLILVGLFLFGSGTVVSSIELVKVFGKDKAAAPVAPPAPEARAL